MLQEEVEDVPEKVYSINELRNIGNNASKDAACPDAEDIATIIFTSGTTGKSKGVMLTQKNLASNVEAVKISAEPGTVMLSVLPIHHAFCLVMDWLKGFSQGATLCINDSLLHMVRNMSIFKPDIMLMVPMMIETIYKRLAASDPAIPKQVLAEKVFGGKLHTIFTGGAHLDPYYIEYFAQYGIQILEGYGMSECSPVISNNTPENNKPGSIGKPLENVEVRFENGEILVRGTSVMKGYYQMPKETQETLTDGWLHTGDKGYMDEDGYLFINGRVKNLIILSNGENVSPEEIENKLALNPLVGEVIVTGEKNGLTARIYPEQAVVEAKALDAESVKGLLQAFLDKYNQNQPTYRQITGLSHTNAVERLARESGRYAREEKLLDELAQVLGLAKPPRAIESYDISNWGDGTSVCGMVTFKDGKPYKAGYRKFKMKTVLGTDDYASLAETVSRRAAEYEKYAALAKAGEPSNNYFGQKPDLLLMDGGRGQVSAAREALAGTALADVPLYGMVKDDHHRTRAIVDSEGREIAINMNRGTFTFITAIQDETHRFANAYRKQQMHQKSYASTLTEVPGVGPKTAKALMARFKSVGAVREAAMDQLENTPGVGPRLARTIYDHFHP